MKMKSNGVSKSVALLIATLTTVSATAKEVVMRSPSATVQEGERVLNSEEVGELSCTNLVRREISDRPGIVMGSEKVTHSDKHGYIYRYDASQVVEDETYGRHTWGYILVLWTLDCKIFEAATHPTFELPGSE